MSDRVLRRLRGVTYLPLAVVAATQASAQQEPPQLLILHTGDTRGYVEPCG